MKTLSFLFSFIFLLSANSLFAQAKTDSFDVSGVCGMCKKKIETAAKAAGATEATWSVATKKLTVTYPEAATVAAIQKSIAASGYDTPTEKATDAAYNALHDCCKYERTNVSANAAKAACCADGKCEHTGKKGVCAHCGKTNKDGKKATASCCAKV